MRSDEEYGFGEEEEKTSAAAKTTRQHHDATSDKQRTHTIRAGYGVRECRSLAFTASVVSSQKRATSSTLPDLAASCTELQTPPPATAAMSIPVLPWSSPSSSPSPQNNQTTKPPKKTQEKKRKTTLTAEQERQAKLRRKKPETQTY
jgi:hypothetical protein